MCPKTRSPQSPSIEGGCYGSITTRLTSGDLPPLNGKKHFAAKTFRRIITISERNCNVLRIKLLSRGKVMKGNHVQFLWRDPEVVRAFATGVCLHGHTMHSRECLSFCRVIST